MKTERELLDLKEKVEKAKTTISGLEGQKTALVNQLKADFKVTTMKDAEAKLSTLTDEITSLEKEIESKVAEIENKYPA